MTDLKRLAEKIYLLFDGYLDEMCDDNDEKELMEAIQLRLKDAIEDLEEEWGLITEKAVNEALEKSVMQHAKLRRETWFADGMKAAYTRAAEVARTHFCEPRTGYGERIAAAIERLREDK